MAATIYDEMHAGGEVRTHYRAFDEWLAGQGGYGFQTTPAMALAAAALVDRRPLPASIADRGVAEAALSPARFSGA